MEDAEAFVKEIITRAPRLMPIYSHRVMPDRPHQAGNPIFSIHQTDLIHYGFDLDVYFRHEFGLPVRKPWPSEIQSIEFWEPERWQQRWQENQH